MVTVGRSRPTLPYVQLGLAGATRLADDTSSLPAGRIFRPSRDVLRRKADSLQVSHMFGSSWHCSKEAQEGGHRPDR